MNGHLGYLKVSDSTGNELGEIEVLPGKLSQSAYEALRAELVRVWGDLIFDPEGVRDSALDLLLRPNCLPESSDHFGRSSTSQPNSSSLLPLCDDSTASVTREMRPAVVAPACEEHLLLLVSSNVPSIHQNSTSSSPRCIACVNTPDEIGKAQQ